MTNFFVVYAISFIMVILGLFKGNKGNLPQFTPRQTIVYVFIAGIPVLNTVIVVTAIIVLVLRKE
jgi:hypothetical protein